MRKMTFPEIKLENATCPYNFWSRDIKIYFPSICLRECEFRHSHKKRKDSLETQAVFS